MKLMRLYLFITIGGFLLESCNTSSSSEVKTNEAGSRTTTRHDTSDYFDRLTGMLKLRDLKKDNNGDHVRIWFNYLSDSGRVVEFHKIPGSNEWTSQVCYFKLISDASDSLLFTEQKCEQSRPKSGWSAFLREVDFKTTFQLKDHSVIPNYQICHDGDLIVLQIATDTSYREVTYPCYTTNKVDEAKHLIKAIQTIEKEFGYRITVAPYYMEYLKKQH